MGSLVRAGNDVFLSATQRDIKMTQPQLADIYRNEKILAVVTCSGLNMAIIDTDAETFFFELSPEPLKLGQAVRSALQASRMFTHEEARIRFHPEARDREYENWVAALMRRFGYKKRQAVFRRMNNCFVSKQQDIIEIIPSRHRRSDGWDWLDKKDYVYIPETASDEEIGVAALLALSRCIG